MPAKSQAQARLFRAAEHGAKFAMAEKLRTSMTHQQMHDFAATSTSHLPAHVKPSTHMHHFPKGK
jgi:hypothetical protein